MGVNEPIPGHSNSLMENLQLHFENESQQSLSIMNTVNQLFGVPSVQYQHEKYFFDQ